MARGAQAALAAGIAVFGFDADPGVPPSRALQVLILRRGLPRGDVEGRERFAGAALRVAGAAGVDLGARRGARSERLHLVGIDDDPGRGARTVTVWYYATARAGESAGAGTWSAVGRGLRLDARDGAALRQATERLRQDARQVGGAAALLGDVFTGDDLLRVHIALHGGPEGSDRTFRRRIQELRDSGVLRPVADREVAALRARVPRFRSPAGTGGRPPELFRYAGSGGENEQLVALRARRSA
jgi:ADP-ribose pyrophosphatase YjhB (NUDIX family)